MFIAINEVAGLEFVCVSETEDGAVEGVRAALAKAGEGESCIKVSPIELDQVLRPTADSWEDGPEDDLGDDSRFFPGEEMDGDFDSAMASAGHGTDEDYGSFGEDE